MNENIEIAKQLSFLIEEYAFNIDTLTKYLKLNNNEIQRLTNGDIAFLPNDNQYRLNLFNKILFLYDSVVNEKDLKLKDFLKVLISYHNISKETISKISGVDIRKINKFLSLKDNKISIKDKYKLAMETISLSFFLKGDEKVR